MPAQLLDRRTFSSDEQKALRAVFVDHYQQGQSAAFFLNKDLFSRRASLAIALEIYSHRLNRINPALLQYLSDEEKKVQEQDLLYTFYLLSAQYQLDENEDRHQDWLMRRAQLLQCARYIETIKAQVEHTSEEQLNSYLKCSEKHLKYLGLTTLAPLLADTIEQISSGVTVSLFKWMREVNVFRLYWVWAGGTLLSALEMFPSSFEYKTQAQDAIAAPGPYTGYMSWILYYTRLGIQLSLLLKHTFAGPWMSQAEREVPWQDRFTTQWEQRKYSIINDLIWGTANLACFYWLIGSGFMGMLGNVATTGLLLVDTVAAIYGYYEAETQHNKEVARYQEDINEFGVTDTLERKVQLASLQKTLAQYQLDWRYKRYGLINDLVYSVSLMTAFLLCCSFFFPPFIIAPATALLLGVIGASLCFVLNMVYVAAGTGLKIEKSRASAQAVYDECGVLLGEFKTSIEDNRKRSLYLQIRSLLADSNKEGEQVRYQQLQQVHTILISALLPPLLLLSFLFFPLGIGLGMVAVGVAVAIISKMMLNQLQPDQLALPVFDEAAYSLFEKNPQLPPFKMSLAKGFFGAPSERHALASGVMGPEPKTA